MIKVPFTVNQIPKKEIHNNISFHLFGYEAGGDDAYGVYPLYISKTNMTDRCDVLLITKEEKTHYVRIKDFNRLMLNKTKHANKKHFCKPCSKGSNVYFENIIKS